MTDDSDLQELIKDLEALADEFEGIAELSGVNMHQLAYESAAERVREVIQEHRGASDE